MDECMPHFLITYTAPKLNEYSIALYKCIWLWSKPLLWKTDTEYGDTETSKELPREYDILLSYIMIISFPTFGYWMKLSQLM